MNPTPEPAKERPASPYVNAWNTVRFTPSAVARPRTRDELVALVRDAHASGRKIKAIGGHSFNRIIVTDGLQVDLRHLNRVIEIDPDAGTAVLEGGVTLGDTIEALDRQGLQFSSLGSWFTQSISGAIATSTHGSTRFHGSLSDAVLEVEAVLADGSVAQAGGEDDVARAFRARLGQLGLITRVKLQLEPAFWLQCSIDTVADTQGFASIVGIAHREEYVSMLWLPYAERVCIRVLRRTDARRRNDTATKLERRFGRKGRLYNTVEDVAIFLYGHAFLRLPRLLSSVYSKSVQSSFFDDVDTVDKSFEVFLYDPYREPTENHYLRMILNTEHAIETSRLESALLQIKRVIEHFRRKGRYINYPRIHVRFAPASDRTLVGLNAGRETAYVGIYIVGSIHHAPQIEVAEAIETVLIEHDGRPHWGKYRYVDSDRFEQAYPDLERFRAIHRQLDPQGMFSDGDAMFTGLDRFRKPAIGCIVASLFDRQTYSPIRRF
jgi:FAD/FMN-containing dehydrogenase